MASAEQPIQPDEMEPLVGSLGEKSSRKKRSAPRKKTKKQGHGFEPNRIEPKPHDADVNRYDPLLPFDQRLLRAVDEWRSLRSLPFDIKLNFDFVLEYFKLDVHALREKFGRQALRGYSAYAEEAAADSDSDGAEIFELDDSSEQAWMTKYLGAGSIARWLDDRSRDGYTPTLTYAPTVMGNFLTFLLARHVLPVHEAKIKAVLPMIEIAKAQLAPSASLFRHLPPPFHESLATLLPSMTSTLASPIAEHDPPTVPCLPTIPALISAATFVDSTTDLDIDLDTTPFEGWPAGEHDAEGGDEKDPLNDPLRRAEMIRKQFEEEAKSLAAWTVPELTGEDATRLVRGEMERLGVDIMAEGVWRIAHRERSARSVVGWEKIELKPGKVQLSDEGGKTGRAQEPGSAADGQANGAIAGALTSDKPTGAGGESNGTKGSGTSGAHVSANVKGAIAEQVNAEPVPPTPPPQLYRLKLSPHLTDFPLTASHTPSPDPAFPPHSLATPISIIVPEPATKFLVKGVVFEADFAQIVFCPAGDITASSSPRLGEPSSSPAGCPPRSSTAARFNATSETPYLPSGPADFFVLTELYRVLPSYYAQIGEYCRDEPEKQKSFPGGWKLPNEDAVDDSETLTSNGDGRTTRRVGCDT